MEADPGNLPVFNTSILEKARQLLAGKMLWKFADHRSMTTPALVPDGFAGALVLDNAPEPYRVIWNKEDWDCDCSDGAMRKPCVHLAALLIKMNLLMADSGEMTDTPPVKFDYLDPEQHLLFFSLPEDLKTVPAIILGKSDRVERVFSQSAFPVQPSGIVFKDLEKNDWRITAGKIPVREDGSYGKPCLSKSSVHPSIESIPGDETITLSQLEASDIILDLLDSPVHVVNIHGDQWTLIEGGKVHICFDPLLTAAGQEFLFKPRIYIQTETGCGDVRKYSGSPAAAANGLLVFDESNQAVVQCKGIGSARWFIRLILSRKTLSGTDIQARLSRDRHSVAGIEIDAPDLPDHLPTLTPSLILDIVNRGNWINLRSRFRYESALLTPEETGDIVSIKGRGLEEQPIGLRSHSDENELIRRAESILTGALCWRRGHYSGLTKNQDVPFRIELPLSDFLIAYGKQLLDADIEIRLENRPIRIGGRIQIKINEDGMQLNMNTHIESEDGRLSVLDLDPWLTEGVVRAGEDYFILGKKALEQLNFLRQNGMNDSGFLSTSPENLSLIDAVYAQIHIDENSAMDLEEKRSLYHSLVNFTPENPLSPPDPFRGELRPYQLYGYAWLIYMREHGLGACLADDMGLGKTVQTLAYLSHLNQSGRPGPTLLVGPVVTLSNWAAEISRFTPELRFHLYSGPPEKRSLPEPDSGIHIVIVSYQTLRIDAEKFFSVKWDTVILDEAHYVKNASSQTFKTVRSLRAANRLSLTGTPLENHLGELWSQMTFLNPGLLGRHHEFLRRFGETHQVEQLKRIVSPFILRRHKEDVLDELPAKDEIVMRCEMTAEQTEVYQAMSRLYYQQATGLLSREGLSGGRIQILSLLTRLRLLAIHPPMAGEQFNGISSGKMQFLDSFLTEVLEENHKVLVFSQFLGVLDQAERTCLRYNWDFRRLTGSTRNRETPIAEFMDDPGVRIFLLSLRAGSVGINLTAADYVILLDPWWNPAVEGQAVDRAHRMGQQRPVTAYKFIASGTIEEKVLDLQERKKDLVSGILDNEGMPQLTEDDILNLFL